MTEIRPAGPGDLEALVPLFDAYRVFYEGPSDRDAGRRFLGARLSSGDSRIFLGLKDGRAIGFIQLYPSFSSVSMRRLWILNDLYVHPEARRSGTAKALMAAAEGFARADGAKGLALATQIGNRTAQELYAKMGYRKEEAFYHYSLTF
ncbi:MAG: GNAT family N-acetyltransferase [Fibrobacteres bacterium]|nr:GNAT family N-acetyltransferase [Fibrobacterota bacterium]